MATDPTLEVLTRDNAGHEHQVVSVEDLVQQPVVTHAIPQKGVARSLNGLDLLALRARVVFEHVQRLHYAGLIGGEQPLEGPRRLPRQLDAEGLLLNHRYGVERRVRQSVPPS